MFSCDGSGNYALNILLDSNGRFKLQVFADGFAPAILRFIEPGCASEALSKFVTNLRLACVRIFYTANFNLSIQVPNF